MLGPVCFLPVWPQGGECSAAGSCAPLAPLAPCAAKGRASPAPTLGWSVGLTSPSVGAASAPAFPHLGASQCRRVQARAGNGTALGSSHGLGCGGRSLPRAAATPCPEDAGAIELDKGLAIPSCPSATPGPRCGLTHRGVSCRMFHGAPRLPLTPTVLLFLTPQRKAMTLRDHVLPGGLCRQRGPETLGVPPGANCSPGYQPHRSTMEHA